MKTEHLWCFFGELLFNDFKILLVIMLLWIWGTEWLNQITIGQEILLDEFLKIGDVGSSVPSICDMTTIHNLSEHVFQIGVRNHLELLEIICQHISTLVQITFIELVSDRESLSTELSTTENQGMVEAKSKQQSFELIWLTGRVNSCLTEVGEGSIQIILQGGWGLIGDLDRVLKNSLRNNITLGRSRWL